MAVRVVTDSTAYLPADVAAAAGSAGRAADGHRLRASRAGRASTSPRPTSPGRWASGGIAVTTSRPGAGRVRRGLPGAARATAPPGSSRCTSRPGCPARTSRPCSAAEEFGGRVRVVDSAAAGIGVGFVALAASAAAAAGGDLEAVRTAALAAVGSGADPVLRRHAGVPAPGWADQRRAARCSAPRSRSSRSCTSSAARSCSRRRSAHRPGRWPGSPTWRVEAAGESDVDIAVQHLDAADRAQALLDLLVARLGDRVRDALPLRGRRGRRRPHRARASSA